jgi:integrase
LKQHQKRQAEEKLSAGPTYDDSGLVFATALGRPLDHNNIVHRQFHSALEKAGLRRIRFHDLRHTCASLLINEGVSPKYIQRQLRHESIQTTFDRYGHLFPETNEEAARVLDDALRGRGVPSNGHLTEQVETV